MARGGLPEDWPVPLEVSGFSSPGPARRDFSMMTVFRDLEIRRLVAALLFAPLVIYAFFSAHTMPLFTADGVEIVICTADGFDLGAPGIDSDTDPVRTHTPCDGSMQIHAAALPAPGPAVGITLHMGTMGLWSVQANTLVCLSVLFLAISSVVMWWKRRPAGTMRLAAPPLPRDMPLWQGAMLVALLVSLAFPMAGLTLIVVLALDQLVLSRIPAVKRALS